MANIVIVDDHQVFRESLVELLKKQGKHKVLWSAKNGAEFVEMLDSHERPHIIIMDISMPEMNGVEATRIALQKYPDAKVLVLTQFGEDKYYYEMVSLGVKGFMMKNDGIKELIQAINELMNGGVWFSNELLHRIIINVNKKPQMETLNSLTDRELEVLKYVCEGYTAEEIAKKINLSYETVKTHKSNLLSKTGCNNAPALVMFAIRNKLIDL